MSFSVDLLSLLLYCVQQLGVVLGVGAQTVLLVFHFIIAREGAVDKREEWLGRAVLSMLSIGLVCIIASGAIITFMHFAAGQAAVIFAPAFLFKWMLIGIICLITFVVGRRPLMHFFWEGVLGSQWYALFILHATAPLISWIDLLILYALWTVAFLILWQTIIQMRSLPAIKTSSIKKETISVPKQAEKPKPALSPQPKPVIMPTVQPKPVAPPPVPPHKPIVATPIPPKPAPVPHKPEELMPPAPPMPQKPISQKPTIEIPKKPALEVPTKPAEDPDVYPGLPAIRVMPTTPQDVDRQMHASSVQFDQQ